MHSYLCKLSYVPLINTPQTLPITRASKKSYPSDQKLSGKGVTSNQFKHTSDTERERQGERDNKQLMSKTIEKDSIEFIKNKKGLQTRRSQYPNHHPC